MPLLARTCIFWSILVPFSTWAERTGQYLPLELPGRFSKLGAHEWLLVRRDKVSNSISTGG